MSTSFRRVISHQRDLHSLLLFETLHLRRSLSLPILIFKPTFFSNAACHCRTADTAARHASQDPVKLYTARPVSAERRTLKSCQSYKPIRIRNELMFCSELIYNHFRSDN